jgi:predicted  nucleic acid-binding Zn-ribbon protein
VSGTITSLAASIRVRAESMKQDIKPALEAIESWGKAAKEAGLDTQTINREMGKMRAEAARGPKAAAEATDSFRQKLTAAKQGAAALSGAISAMSSEVGGAVGHVTRLGTSLTSAFLAGGPVALGVTAISAGIAFIAGESAKAAEEAEKAKKAHSEWAESGARLTQEYAASVDALRRKLAALEGGPAEQRSYERWVRERSAVQVLEKDVERLTKRTADYAAARASQASAEQDAERQRARGSMGGRAMAGHFDEKAAKYAAEAESIQREIAELSAKIATHRATILDLTNKTADAEERTEAAAKKVEGYKSRLKGIVSGINADMERGASATKEMAANAARINAALNKEFAQNIEDAYGLLAKPPPGYISKAQQDQVDKMSEDNFASLGKRLKAFEQEHAARVKSKDELRRQLELMGAANDFDRERMEIANRLADGIAKHAKDEEAQILLKQIAMRENVELAKREADENKRAAEEMKKQLEAQRQKSRLVGERKDITKRFGNVGGSAFGFGMGQAGTGMGDIGADAARAKRAAGDIPGKGSGIAAQLAGGKGLDLPDVSAQMKAMEAEIAKLPPFFERLSGAVTSFSATTRSVVGDLGRSTERAVSGLRSDQNSLKEEVRALARDIERAGGGTGGGD